MRNVLRISAAGLLAACQAVPSGGEAAALEVAAVDLAREELARAIGVGRVELGGGDPTTEAQIVVLPPRLSALEGNSAATTRLFIIRQTDQACVLTEKDGPLEIALPRSACRPL